MLLKYIRKRELGLKIPINDINKNLDLICKKRIQENEFELYNHLLNNSKYGFRILIDGKEIKEINSNSHDITIYFENYITKENFLVKKLNLNKVEDEIYNFFDNDDNIQFETKFIISQTNKISQKDIDIYDKEIIKKIISYKSKKWYKYKIIFLIIFFVFLLIIYLFKNSSI